MKKTRVLVVDDSRTMRSLICHALSRDPDIEVVGQAADPLEARNAMKTLDPDVVTLDVEMPNMNGIEFLSKIMRLRPTPVIMVSNLTHEGTVATIAALGNRRGRLRRQTDAGRTGDLRRPAIEGEGGCRRPPTSHEDAATGRHSCP